MRLHALLKTLKIYGDTHTQTQTHTETHTDTHEIHLFIVLALMHLWCILHVGPYSGLLESLVLRPKSASFTTPSSNSTLGPLTSLWTIPTESHQKAAVSIVAKSSRKMPHC